MSRLLFVILIAVILATGGCATGQPQLTSAQQPNPRQSEPEKAEQSEEEPPSDEEDPLVYRLLAAPEYLWEGFTYPFKRMSIFYEQVDLLERALDFFLNEERTGGVYPRFSFGGAISSGVGFTAFHNNLFKQKKKVRLSYLFAVRANQTIDFSYTDPAVLGSRFKVGTNLLFLDFDEGQFFLGGNRAGEGDLTKFDLEQVSWDVKVSRPVVGNLRASLLGRFFHADAGGGRSPPTPATVSGIGTSIEAFEVSPGVLYDTRDSEFRPSTGWLFDSGFTFTEQVDGRQFRYLGYWADVQRYIPVFRGNRVLLLRAYLAKLDSLNDRSIPFYELNLLDLNHGLRGFERGRWRGEGALLFNVEWRYPVWEQIEGSIFFDEGQVFNDFKDLNTRTFRYSAGGGFRFVTKRKFSFRVQVAVSEDGILGLLKGDLEFSRGRGAALSGF